MYAAVSDPDTGRKTVAQFCTIGVLETSTLQDKLDPKAPSKLLCALIPSWILERIGSALAIAYDKWDASLCLEIELERGAMAFGRNDS